MENIAKWINQPPQVVPQIVEKPQDTEIAPPLVEEPPIVEKRQCEYNIVYSITAHENFRFLVIQIKNVLKYNLQSAVLVHLSDQFSISAEEIRFLRQMPNVYVNPTRLHSEFYKVLTPLASNMVYSMENIDYEYMCMLTSNCMFFKKGAFEYMKQYDYGAYAFENRNFTGKWGDCRRYSLSIGGEKEPNYTGQHEGSFMKKELLSKLYESFFNFCPLDRLNELTDTTEETILPTGLNILYKGLKRGYPVCLIRDRMKHLEIGTDADNNVDKTMQYLRHLTDHPEAMVDYVLEDRQEDNHFFAFKRVNRTMINNPLLDRIQMLQV